MILTSYAVPLKMVATPVISSYLSLSLSEERNEYGIYPTQEQEEGFKVGASYITSKKKVWTYLSSPGVLSSIKSVFASAGSEDFSAYKMGTVKGMCFNFNYELVPIDERFEDTNDNADDELLVETAKAAARRADPDFTIRLEDIDPTWVYKYITMYIKQLQLPNSSNHTDKYKPIDTGAIYDEDGSQLSWSSVISDKSYNEQKNISNMLESLAYDCRYLYEAGKRPNLNVHLLSACACIRHFIEHKSVPSHIVDLTTRKLVLYIKNKWTTTSYDNPSIHDKVPGIRLIYNYCRDRNSVKGTALTPAIVRAMENVINITTELGISLTDKEGFYDEGNVKNICNYVPYFIEKFNDNTMPKMMREVLIQNDTHREDMFYLLKNLYKDSVTAPEEKKEWHAALVERHTEFERNYGMLVTQVMDGDSKRSRIAHVNELETPNKNVIASINMWIVSCTPGSPLKPRFKQEFGVDLGVYKYAVDTIDVYDGIFCCKVVNTLVPINVTINGKKHFIANGGLIIPVDIDYLSDFVLYTVDACTKAFIRMQPISSVGFTMYCGGTN